MVLNKKGMGVSVFLMISFLLFTSCTKKKEVESEVPKNPEKYMVSHNEGSKSAGGTNSHGRDDVKPQGHGGGKDSVKPKMEILVPEDVKNTWESVKLLITDKKTNKQETAEVKIGDKYKVRGSGIVIHVGQLLPDFRMDALTMTSMSNEPNNPAVNVTIVEGGKEIFTGWLYSRFPDVHPFEHPQYAVILVEGVRKK